MVNIEKKGSYKNLVVWQKSMDLVTEIYRLTAQEQRCAVAIPSNIAEGQKKGHSKEFLQFLHISYGSGAELETQIEICKRLLKTRKLDYSKAEPLLLEVMKMLNVLISSLKKK